MYLYFFLNDKLMRSWRKLSLLIFWTRGSLEIFISNLMRNIAWRCCLVPRCVKTFIRIFRFMMLFAGVITARNLRCVDKSNARAAHLGLLMSPSSWLVRFMSFWCCPPVVQQTSHSSKKAWHFPNQTWMGDPISNVMRFTSESCLQKRGTFIEK